MRSSYSVVETDHIGTNVTIHEFVVIRKNVEIGDNVVIHPHVVIEEGVIIGQGVEIFPGAYLGKTPKGIGVTARPIQYKPSVLIGDNCSIGTHAVLYYDVEVGQNTLIGDGASIREGCQVGSFCIIGRYVTVNYNSKIADRVKIMDHAWLAGNMCVGNNVFISGGVLTANDNNIGSKGYEEEKVVGPVIGDHSLIGVGAILLPNTIIGEHAVVAAGAVVTKDVAPNSVVMGIPAKMIRSVENNGTAEEK